MKLTDLALLLLYHLHGPLHFHSASTLVGQVPVWRPQRVSRKLTAWQFGKNFGKSVYSAPSPTASDRIGAKPYNFLGHCNFSCRKTSKNGHQELLNRQQAQGCPGNKRQIRRHAEKGQAGDRQKA